MKTVDNFPKIKASFIEELTAANKMVEILPQGCEAWTYYKNETDRLVDEFHKVLNKLEYQRLAECN